MHEVAVHLDERRILDEGCRMHDAGQRRHAGADLAQHAVQPGPVGDVDRKGPHGGPGRADAGKPGLRFLGLVAAPAEQRERAGAVCHQPFGGGQAEAAKAAGDEPGAVIAATAVRPARRSAAFHAARHPDR